MNRQLDKNGMKYAVKAVVRTGISLNYNGRWEECQLSYEIQKIIAKYRNYFNGYPVHPWDVETESDTDND